MHPKEKTASECCIGTHWIPTVLERAAHMVDQSFFVSTANHDSTISAQLCKRVCSKALREPSFFSTAVSLG